MIAVMAGISSLAWQVGIFLLLSRLSINIFFVLWQTLFFKTAGVEMLPWVYITMNGVYISLQLGVGRRLAGNSARNLLQASLLFAIFVALRFVLPGESALLATGFLLAVMIYELFFHQFFTHFLHELFPLQESKQQLPFITACGNLSVIGCGLLLPFFLTFWNLNQLLAVNLVLFSISLIAFQRLRRFARSSTGGSFVETQDVNSPVDISIPRLVRPLAIFTLLFTLGKYWLDYQYSAAITRSFPRVEDLAAFIGVFTAVTDIGILGCQFMLARPLLKRSPLTLLFTILPAITLISVVTSILIRDDRGILVTQFIFTLLAKSFHLPAAALVLGILTATARNQAQTRLGLAASTGSLAAGLGLVAIQSWLSVNTALAILGMMFAGMLVLVRQIEKMYLLDLEQTLSGESAGERLQALPGLSRLPQEKRADYLRNVFQKGQSDEIIAALPACISLTPDIQKKLLYPMIFQEKDYRVRTAAAQLYAEIVGPDDGLLKLMQNEQTDPRLLAGIISGLADNDLHQKPALINTALNHGNGRVKAAAAILAVRTGDPAMIETGLRLLRKMIIKDADSASRSAALAELSRLRHEVFLPAFEDALNDSDNRVMDLAVRALSDLGTLEAAEVLHTHARNCPDEPRGKRAKAAAGQINRERTGDVCRLAERMSRVERTQIMTSLRDGGDETFQWLEPVLNLEADGLRKVLLTFLAAAEEPGQRKEKEYWRQGIQAGEWDPETALQATSGQIPVSIQTVLEWFSLLQEEKLKSVMDLFLVAICERAMLISGCVYLLKPEADLTASLAVRRAITLVSGRTSDPDSALEAMERAFANDRFAVSLAEEYLSRHLPVIVNEALQRLLQGLRSPDTLPVSDNRDEINRFVDESENNDESS